MSNAPPDCSACPRLCASRKAVVNGWGPGNADIMVIGQGPGKEEERHKPPQPLVGWSGRRLVYLFAVAGVIPMPDLAAMSRIEVREWYQEARTSLPVRLENITRCRPPRTKTGDLPPKPEEIANCRGYLEATLAEVRPAFVITLGAPALKWFRPDGKIAEIHGKPFTWRPSNDVLSSGISGTVDCGDRIDSGGAATHKPLNEPNDSIIVIPMYHPAASHPTRSPELVSVILDDWKRFGAIYREEPETQLGLYSGVDAEAVARLLSAGVDFAFDFETTDPNWKRTFQAVRAPPIGVSVATEAGTALYLESTDMEVLRGPLEDPTVESWAHNAIFEYIVARKQGIRPRNLNCTKALAHVLRRPSTGLKRLTWTELGVQQTAYGSVDWDDLDEVIQYGSADSDLTWRLKEKLLAEVIAKDLWPLYEMERDLIPVLGDMQIRGVRLNPAPLEALGRLLEAEQQEILQWLAVYCQVVQLPEEDCDAFNFNSTHQLRELLYGSPYFRPRCTGTLAGRLQHSPECVAQSRKTCVVFSCAQGVRTGAQSKITWLPPGLAWPVTTRTAETDEPATDMDTIRSYRDRDPELVDVLVKLASIQKCLSNDVRRLPELVQEDGRIHGAFHSAGGWEERPGVAKEGPMTSRLSSSGPNWQNRTHHGDSERPYVAAWAKYVRRAVVATEGLVLVASDIGQEEPRIAAWDAGEELLLWELDHGDVYCPVASLAFGREITKADVEERQIGKRGFMAWLNGAGPAGIQQSAYWLDTPAAQAIIDWLGAKYAKIEARRAALVAHLYKTGYTATYFGHRVLRNSIFSGPGPARNHAERSVMPDFIQGTAAGVVKLWMPRMDAALVRLSDDAHLLLSIHDELVKECPPELVSTVASLAQETLNGILPLHLPCEVKTGPNWSDMEKVN